VPKINKVLGAGTKQPGLHVKVVVVPSPGKYLPAKDTPVYGDNLGPHCYSVPFRGIHLNDGTSSQPPGKAGSRAGSTGASPGARAGAKTTASGGLASMSVAGSPGESRLVTELAGLSLRKRPSALPSWGGLLVAPLFRGAEVIIR
jgi:phospholipid/cholesterol/gamma-HCH transport system substrate-binding protein